MKTANLNHQRLLQYLIFPHCARDKKVMTKCTVWLFDCMEIETTIKSTCFDLFQPVVTQNLNIWSKFTYEILYKITASSIKFFVLNEVKRHKTKLKKYHFLIKLWIFQKVILEKFWIEKLFLENVWDFFSQCVYWIRC